MPRLSKAESDARRALAAAQAATDAATPPDPEKVAKARAQKVQAEAENLKRALEQAETDKEKAFIQRRLDGLTASPDLTPNVMVRCRVLPVGDGKISRGEHIGGIGELHYDKGDEFMGLRESAEILQRRGWLEIL